VSTAHASGRGGGLCRGGVEEAVRAGKDVSDRRAVQLGVFRRQGGRGETVREGKKLGWPGCHGAHVEHIFRSRIAEGKRAGEPARARMYRRPLR
jgi:hypothetical protein